MEPSRTRFYLDKQHAKLFGVCAGIADYTGFDPTWVRVGTVLMVFLGAPFVITGYIVTALIADPKPAGLYASPDEAKFWQGVRAGPGRSVHDVRRKFGELNRRLADLETQFTSRNRRLADEIDALR